MESTSCRHNVGYLVYQGLQWAPLIHGNCDLGRMEKNTEPTIFSRFKEDLVFCWGGRGLSG